jgi:hypothetical protein
MPMFRYQNLMLNIGRVDPCGILFSCDFGTGCAGFNSGCGNFPNTCHVWTCFLGSKICGIPSCNYTGPIGPGSADPLILAKLKTDLQEAIREIEAMEGQQGQEQIDAALKQIDEAAAELKALRTEVAKRKKAK